MVKQQTLLQEIQDHKQKEEDDLLDDWGLFHDIDNKQIDDDKDGEKNMDKDKDENLDQSVLKSFTAYNKDGMITTFLFYISNWKRCMSY